MSRIVKLKADNFKRLKAVEITPDGDLVVVSGRNGQGKTSVLDAITAALGGVSAKNLPKPIRDGAGSAVIELETEDLHITRRFTPSGSTLTVVGKDGVKIPKGQDRLNTLLGRLSLDPLAFTQLDAKKQLETLLELVELPFDPAALEQERAEIFDQRTEDGRKVKELSAKLAGHTVEPGDPLDEVSVSGLLAELDAAQNENYLIGKAATERDGWAEAVRRAERELLHAKGMLADAQQAVIDAGEPRDIEKIRVKLDNVEDLNRAARRNTEWITLKESYDFYQANVEDLTKEIEQIDQRKRDGLAAAKFPGGLPLGFDESGVLLNGVPFKQASGAEQLRASLAMAIALNPELRVIRIADGSLLDSEGLRLVADMAEQNDCQVWLEVVSDDGDFGICIEDGEVVDPEVF